MERIEYRTVDKSKWPRGEWDNEPDKIQWQDEATGLPCLIVRGPVGALCGYVGLPPGHRYFGVDYDNAEADVHGGLTFAGGCQHTSEDKGVCHKPAVGEPDNVWWLGFDCAHCGDLTPKMSSRFDLDDEGYRNVDYVAQECARLAAQLALASAP